MFGYIPVHKTAFIEACKVSRSMPQQPFTNLWIAQGKQQIYRCKDYGAICTEWTFENCWLNPRDGTVLQRRRFLGNFQRGNKEQLHGISSGATERLCWHSRASRVRTCAITEAPAGCSNRPDFSPAQPWRAETRLVPSKAAAPRLTLVSRFTVPWSDARTKLMACLSTLLEQITDQLHRLFGRDGGINEMRREIFEQAHSSLVGPQQNHGFLCLQRQRNF